MKKTAAIIITVLLLANGSPAQAEVITIAIEATVDWVDDPCDYLEGNITPGDIITGTYTYDSDTANSSTTPTVGSYWHYDSPFGMELNAGGFEFKTDPANVEFLVQIVNDHGVLEYDGYLLRSYNNLPLSNGVPVDHISWQLDDYSGQAISSTDLTTSAPVLANWDQPIGLRLESDRRFHVQSQVTSAYVIPESNNNYSYYACNRFAGAGRGNYYSH